MLRETRLHRIQSLLSTLQQVSTERIIHELGISRETARRDIIELESLGLARRVHGGLVAMDASTEAPLPVRKARQSREKIAIARAALPYLQAGQTLFLDSGSTTTQLAQELRTLPGLTIITNSLQAALLLSTDDIPHQNDVILIGGSLRPGAEQTGGEQAIAEIQRYRADIALLSPVGVDAQNGASSFWPQEAAIARAMARQAGQLFILADSSKLGIISRVSWAPPTDIHKLITDRGAQNQPALPALQAALPEVVLA